jgi:hypothetical protein
MLRDAYCLAHVHFSNPNKLQLIDLTKTTVGPWLEWTCFMVAMLPSRFRAAPVMSPTTTDATSSGSSGDNV